MDFFKNFLRSGLILIAATMVLFTQRCENLVESDVSTQLNLKVGVTKDFQGGVAQTLQKSAIFHKAMADSGLALNERVSFTPTSMRIFLEEAYLNTTYPPGNGNQIHIPISQEIDLIGQDALVDLLYQEVEIDSAEFDNYTRIHLELQDSAVVSGSVTIQNVDYAFSDLKISMGLSGVGGCIPDTLRIEEEVDATVTALLDVENSFAIERADDGDIGVHLSDTVGVNIQNAILLPYAGEVAPSVEKYVITWDSDAAQYHYLEVVALKNGSGKLANIGIRNVYTEGFNRSMGAFQPASWLDVQFTETEPGIYEIHDNAEQNDAPMISFPAFQLQDHQSTFDYTDPFDDVTTQQRMSYTATKLD
ncbi:MAG: hypothetical protein GF372_09630 [Candidatus Marinimicrobia bacterium]|nr:hypothetical protein [Candidatus Neomarinimicrobiota bacterium]